MKFDELRSRFELIDDEPSGQLCLTLVQAVLALRCNIEYIASPAKTSTARREQAKSLHPILMLCHEKGRQLKNDHPNSHYLQLRVDILVKMISEMSVDELGSETGETFILSPINPAFENPLSRERGNDKE
ncbi:hypothetical protein KOEU_31820 [Komagataeibacter europaeus]|uniref:Uncharacterized protein n=3 Tax=Acetobacteraceae TaxID=433 RepID=A0AAW5ENW6_NOVHA|nr:MULTISPECIES: hypothetical protein [Acetobacteraceae]KON63301.1 hypothetical protein KOEU_31820 [Komagataeibacter europaeus]MCJ8352881.1 hypothetical protein [Novacetimonas hansenii]PYD74593.1 hypothetical protein CFR71_14090 [Novacetimonas pomaceti]